MTAPHYADDMVTVYVGDCRKVLPGVLADATVDAVVTDPPYELGFMGRGWDASGVAFDPATWQECLRVTKPGAHLLAFGGTRTWHRVAVAIEDAGWELRDTVMWVYGSGFPKSLDVSKAIDKQRDDRADVLKVTAWLAAARDAAGWTNKQIDGAFGFSGMAGHWTAKPHLKIAYVPTWDQWLKLKELLVFGDDMDAEVWRLNGRKGKPGEAWTDRPVVGERTTGIGTGRGAVAYIGDSADRTLTAAATDLSRQWEGWGTALKPGWEPIILARKPLAGTVAQNVQTYGTGALNIDACRTVAGQDYRDKCASVVGLDSNRNGAAYGEWTGAREDSASPLGRWPTNLVFSHGALCIEDGPCEPDCPVAELDRQSGMRPGGHFPARRGPGAVYDRGKSLPTETGREARVMGDGGGASRFFPVFRYEAKAPNSERPKLADGTAHATVKPLDLIRWLTRLITPPGGLVLDPFGGSGTTAEAATIEGFRSVLIELEPPHAELIKQRLSKPIQPTLFGQATP